jgi:hypothetical protein
MKYVDVPINYDILKYDPINGLTCSEELIVESKSYRCHLRGIVANKGMELNNIVPETKRIIYDNDGWVMCLISDIDIYGRILIDLYDINQIIHLNNVLLENYPENFSNYSVKKFSGHGRLNHSDEDRKYNIKRRNFYNKSINDLDQSV